MLRGPGSDVLVCAAQICLMQPGPSRFAKVFFHADLCSSRAKIAATRRCRVTPDPGQATGPSPRRLSPAGTTMLRNSKWCADLRVLASFLRVSFECTRELLPRVPKAAKMCDHCGRSVDGWQRQRPKRQLSRIIHENLIGRRKMLGLNGLRLSYPKQHVFRLPAIPRNM